MFSRHIFWASKIFDVVRIRCFSIATGSGVQSPDAASAGDPALFRDILYILRVDSGEPSGRAVHRIHEPAVQREIRFYNLHRFVFDEDPSDGYFARCSLCKLRYFFYEHEVMDNTMLFVCWNCVEQSQD